MGRYWNGSHTTHRLNYHLVWIPKFRKRVLRGKIAVKLRQLLYQACKINQWYASELSIQPDHIHMVVQIRPSESVADVVGRLKGGTSKVIRTEFPDLEEFIWGESFWADGYFAETIGQANEEIVRKYIRWQSR